MARAVEVNANRLDWTPTRWPGISRKLLRDDPATGARAAHPKFEPHARLPRHMHPAGEETLVLEGRIGSSGVPVRPSCRSRTRSSSSWW